ncbi:MAG: signal peptidase I [Acholeplasmatales bacterium]|jgi:signal peptidase I|nr:signal peptidase I [Acholeplasmatales bacterium]
MSKVKKIIYLAILSLFVFLIALFLVLAGNLISYTLVIVSLIFGGLSLILMIYLLVSKLTMKSKLLSFCDYVAFIASSLLIITFVLTFFFQVHRVDGSSMYPTLEDGKLVAVYPLALQEIKNGDIVVVRVDGEEELLVKRVFASPGDVINYFYLDGVYYVKNNTSEVVHPDFAKNENLSITLAQWSTLRGVSTIEDETPTVFILPLDCYLVLGDNFDISQDSRYFGPIKRTNIYGKILFK